MILSSVLAAMNQMTDPRFRRVLFTGITLTLALLIGASVLFVWMLSGLIGEQVTLPFIGEVRWLDDLASWGIGIALAVLSTFLMIPVASAITSLFLDTVAQAVEDEHYPKLGKARPVPFLDAILDSIAFLGVLIVANLLALIVYLILIATVAFAPAAALVFWGLNGFLLGREYFTLAAIRRVGRKQAKVLQSRYALTIWAAGILMAIPLSIPILNLMIPILGAATFTHLFHRLAPQPPYG